MKKCADLNQGHINITSEVGIGTTCASLHPPVRNTGTLGITTRKEL
ncbi:hypothetical protein [Nostoc sp. FACHB-133]|nr:hypothetical protein [Nostoc sp. FACHB-133]MBD2522321.1 hypothetical protein [Nostoc sp. FACHB-133]